MAFIERVADRQLNSVAFEDEANPILHRLVASPVPLHYLDDGGNFQRIDMSPVRINPGDWARYPNFDGWLVSQNGWLYGLGTDGYVYFGGRRGEHYVRFRLREIGYVRTATGAFTPISGLPDYNTANLSAKQTQTVIEGETYIVGTTAEWRSLNTTPGGGELYLRFKARGDGLKSEYVITQAAREWIVANRPPLFYGIPAAQAYLAFRFDIDWSDIPQKLINSVLQGDTFNDAAGGIELRNALDELLAFMPVGYATAGAGFPGRQSVTLRKQFSGNLMVMGASVAALNELPAGDLVFDPTITPHVAAGGDNWAWITSADFSNSDTEFAYGYYSPYLVHNGYRFTNITVPAGSTVTACYATLVAAQTLSNTVSAVQVHFVDADNPTAATTYTNAEAQPRTTAYATWTPGAQTAGTGYNTPSLVTPAQAVFNRAGWASGQAVIVVIRAVTATNNYRVAATYQHATYTEPILTITYTPTATNYPQSVSGALTPTGAAVKLTVKSAVGSIAPSGVLSRLAGKALTGAVTPAGALSAITVALKTITGALTPSGTLSRDTGKTLAGAATPAGALIKHTARALVGALTPSGALTAARAAYQSISGTLAPVGTLARATSTALSGALTPTGALIKNAAKSLVGALVPAGTVATIKAVNVALSGALAPVGTLARSTGKTLAGAFTPAGALVRNTAKALAGAFTPTGSLSAVRTFFQSVFGTLAPSGIVAKSIGKQLSGVLAPVGSIIKRIYRTLAGLLTPGGAVSPDLGGDPITSLDTAYLLPQGYSYSQLPQGFGLVEWAAGVGYYQLAQNSSYRQLPQGFGYYEV